MDEETRKGKSMSDALILRSYELPNLDILVKEIWPHSDKWRLEKARIEFSILKSDGQREWFHVSQSPEHVEKFVRAWYKSGGLNDEGNGWKLVNKDVR